MISQTLPTPGNQPCNSGDVADIRRCMKLPDAVRWVRLGDVTTDREIACMDGRHDDCTLGAPGGNTGELLLLASVLEWYAGGTLSRDKVRCLFENYIAAFGRFYLHTDTQALAKLAEAVGEHPAFSGLELRGQRDTLDLVTQPPEAVRPALLELMVMPEHVGCGHLSAMLLDPGRYRVRRGLVEDVLRAFFLELWEGSPHTDFVVLEGRHEEKALLSFHTRKRLDADSLVPGICPSAGGVRVFVSHVPALRYLRRRAVELLLGLGLDPRLDSVDPLDVAFEVERLAERQLALTLERLAPGLPRYRVEFDELELTLAD